MKQEKYIASDYSETGCVNTIKKSIKYILIAIINAAILTALLAIWTDKLELTFNQYARFLGFLKIIGLTAASLSGMRILVSLFKNGDSKNMRRKKILYSIIFTLTISSYLYGLYAVKIHNRLANESIRQSLINKIEAIQLLHGTKADNMTYQEYAILAEVAGFKKVVSESASNISYQYSYDGFLSDYTFFLLYEVPSNTEIEIIDYKNGDFRKSQTFEIIGNKKVVKYEEHEM